MSLKNGSGTTDVETGKPQDPRQDRHPGEGNLAKDSQQMQQQGKRGQDEGKQMGGTKGSSQQQGGHGDQQSQQDRDSRQGFEQGRQAGQANFTGSPSGNQPHQPKGNKQQSQQGGSQGDKQYGVNIIRRACEEPLRQIAANGGWEGSIVVNKVREGKGAFGWNGATGEYEDLVKAGVIDPTKVVRTALTNAASVASLMLTTEAIIADRPKKKEKAAGAGAGHDDMGGDF